MVGGLRISLAIVALACAMGCSAAGNKSNVTSGGVAAAGPVIAPQDKAPAPQQTGGFDGQRAYDYTAKLVSFGPRPSGSDAIKKTQDYISGELRADGCQIDEDNFNAQTPIGTLAMKNIVAKVPGTGKNVILLLTHYDTVRTTPNFVGAEDGGSSTGLMLEAARLLCGKKQPVAIWMAFLDGEEAMVDWNQNNDHTYGSRQMAANLELTGQLKNIKAVILVDMIGQKGLHISKDSYSTPWLTDLVWSTAAKLGYQSVFVPQTSSTEDDHQPFLAKGLAAVDLIDLNDYINEGYWHTAQDTMDKISPKNLAIVGHVVLASVDELEKKFSR